jgi:hypothetical protein
VPRQHLLSGTVPQQDAVISQMANEQHLDDSRSLHTEKRFQAVGISTHARQNWTFTGSGSANSPDNHVERLSSKCNAGKKFPAAENISGVAAQTLVRSWAFQVRDLCQNFLQFLSAKGLLQKSVEGVFIDAILGAGNVAAAQNCRALAPRRADGR